MSADDVPVLPDRENRDADPDRTASPPAPDRLGDAANLTATAHALDEVLDTLRTARAVTTEATGQSINIRRLVAEVDQIGRHLRQLSRTCSKAANALEQDKPLGTPNPADDLPAHLPLSPHQLAYLAKHGRKPSVRYTARPSQYYAGGLIPPPPEETPPRPAAEPANTEELIYEAILHGPLEGDDVGPRRFFAALIAVSCPTCDASPEQSCRSSDGWALSPAASHRPRMQAAAILARQPDNTD